MNTEINKDSKIWTPMNVDHHEYFNMKETKPSFIGDLLEGESATLLHSKSGGGKSLFALPWLWPKPLPQEDTFLAVHAHNRECFTLMVSYPLVPLVND